jgi:hypothetical protein
MQLQANFTPYTVQPVNMSIIPCLDQYSAIVANIEQTRQLDNEIFNFTYPCALQNDVLHYGLMLQADDKQKFVHAMEQENEGLRDILKIVHGIPFHQNLNHFQPFGHSNKSGYLTRQFSSTKRDKTYMEANSIKESTTEKPMHQ